MKFVNKTININYTTYKVLNILEHHQITNPFNKLYLVRYAGYKNNL